MREIYEAERLPALDGGDPTIITINGESDIDVLTLIEEKLEVFVKQDIKEKFIKCTDNLLIVLHQFKVALTGKPVVIGIDPLTFIEFLMAWPITDYEYLMRVPE